MLLLEFVDVSISVMLEILFFAQHLSLPSEGFVSQCSLNVTFYILQKNNITGDISGSYL
jgi:hypothetical protein